MDVAGPFEGRIVVIVAVHSHVPLDVCLKRVHADTIHVVAIPCCIQLDLHRSPDYEYRDEGIWSPKNRVKIWTDVQAKDWQ